MAHCALTRTRLGSYPAYTNSSTPHGRCIFAGSRLRFVGEYAAAFAIFAAYAALAFLALAAFGGCATVGESAKIYHETTVDNHALILPDLRAYVNADETLDPPSRAARLALIDAQQRLDALNTPSPEYARATITRHELLLPWARWYYTADPSLIGGSLRLRTLLIEE